MVVYVDLLRKKHWRWAYEVAGTGKAYQYCTRYGNQG